MINDSSNVGCWTIAAGSNVVIDGKGHTIAAVGSGGDNCNGGYFVIADSSSFNLTIKNVVLINWFFGIYPFVLLKYICVKNKDKT